MKWKDMLLGNAQYTYGVTENLIGMVDDSDLDWKPATGSNWMTMGQLLQHISNAAGQSIKGILTGDWGMPEDMKMEDMSPEDMLPPAEKMPSVESVAEAKRLLEEDKQMTLKLIQETSEGDLENKDTPVPWDPTPLKLGHRLMQMIHHLGSHKAQLFYYLKLQGKPVNTQHLWGM